AAGSSSASFWRTPLAGLWNRSPRTGSSPSPRERRRWTGSYDWTLRRAPARDPIRSLKTVGGGRESMSELRADPISRRWGIIPTERGGRPMDFAAERESPIPGAFCPFCEGHEDKTPPEILAVRPAGGHANGPGWTVRVIPNKYPALMIEGNLDR